MLDSDKLQAQGTASLDRRPETLGEGSNKEPVDVCPDFFSLDLLWLLSLLFRRSVERKEGAFLEVPLRASPEYALHMQPHSS